MKTAALILLTFGLWVAVLGGGMDAWDQEIAGREALDNCLLAGHSPAECTKE